jgi:hypothetical protein
VRLAGWNRLLSPEDTSPSDNMAEFVYSDDTQACAGGYQHCQGVPVPAVEVFTGTGDSISLVDAFVPVHIFYRTSTQQ